MRLADKENVFGQWIEEHLGIIGKTAMSFAKNATDQKDLSQEILLKLWDSIEFFEEKCRPSTWIYRVSFNTALNWKRSDLRYQNLKRGFLELHPGGSNYTDKSKSVENDLITLLRRHIRDLSPIDRSICVLYLDEKSHDEIAEIIGISKANVGVRIYRIKRKLASQMEEKKNKI